MKKLLFSATALLIFLCSVNGAHAQTANKTAPPNALNEEITAARGFSSNLNAQFVKHRFSGKNSDKSAANIPARQQTYIRPTKQERRKRWLSDSFGVPALISSTFGAGIGQIANDPPEWRRTASGFGKRFASSYGTNAIRNTVSYGLSEAFQLDNRFEKSDQKGFGKRLKYVFLGSYTTRTKTGKRLPDFPYVAGTYTGSIIANEVWYPKRYGFQDGLRDGTISLGVRFGVNLLREFVFPR